MIRVLIATAVRGYRGGLQRVLQGAEGIALVGIASTAEQVVEQSCKLLPSVILLDNAMAKLLALSNPFPGAPKVSGMVMLGTPEVYADMLVCLPAETLAFVSCDATVADLLAAIRTAGGRRIPLPACRDARGNRAAPSLGPSLGNRAPHRARDGNPQAHATGPS